VLVGPGAAGASPDRPQAPSGGQSCEKRTNNTYEKLLRCVDADAAFEHLQAFQDIADANGGTRASATPGYDASADYVQSELEAAGYDVTRQEFEFPFFEEEAPAELAQTSPQQVDYETGTFSYSGEGTVDGTIVPVDLALTGDRASTSGCEPEDFDGLDFSGTEVALVQRGACNFSVKVINAQNAGAEAVVIFNQGNDPGRMDVIVGTLGDESAGVVTIPAVGASFDAGVELSVADTARVLTDVFLEFRAT
jgi:hypothetical protein